jgi:very-short-patch-repair endonuclease
MADKLTLEDFIRKSNEKHNNRYDYSKSVYVNSKTKLIIICKEHGEFLQVPSYHYFSGCGCPKCDPTRNLTVDEFIERARNIHKDKYDYSLVEYKTAKDMIKIICKKHGEFIQKAGPHIYQREGCPNCVNNKRCTTEEFIVKAELKHGKLYDYSLVDYKNKKEKVKIICASHGVFEQKAYVHLQGHGCKKCKMSKLERHLKSELDEIGIEYEMDKRFDNCRNVLPLPFDFYIESLNMLIECDGIQHREPVEHFGGEERLEYQQKNDKIKTNFCEENNFNLYRLNSLKDIQLFIKQL